MISKSQIKLIQSLQYKKIRTKYGLFVAEGPKLVADLMQSPIKIHSIFATHQWFESLDEGWPTNSQEISDSELKQISMLSTPHEVLGLFYIPEPGKGLWGPLNLYLDAIRDPGNLGTIVRIADWYGLATIYCSEDCVDAFNPKVVQASMGSIGNVTLVYQNLKSFGRLNEVNKYASGLNGTNLHDLQPTEPALIMIGNEAQGLNPNHLTIADQQFTIPKFGKTESLNAAVAAGITLDNFMRMLP